MLAYLGDTSGVYGYGFFGLSSTFIYWCSVVFTFLDKNFLTILGKLLQIKYDSVLFEIGKQSTSLSVSTDKAFEYLVPIVSSLYLICSFLTC